MAVEKPGEGSPHDELAEWQSDWSNVAEKRRARDASTLAGVSRDLNAKMFAGGPA